MVNTEFDTGSSTYSPIFRNKSNTKSIINVIKYIECICLTKYQLYKLKEASNTRLQYQSTKLKFLNMTEEILKGIIRITE